ncbi:hypothetical protein [Pseudonocardia sp. TRM90224]|uniref:hypothetical protein n=1 Tax=Pseudonocardia sp. TRM90224 TaxID=2812678 RepID=UPI001E3CAC56|nr:hypothetical protein [Pseudonocardia sp. TRM90224]
MARSPSVFVRTLSMDEGRKLAHRAFIAHWTRLRDWLGEDRVIAWRAQLDEQREVVLWITVRYCYPLGSALDLAAPNDVYRSEREDLPALGAAVRAAAAAPMGHSTWAWTH